MWVVIHSTIMEAGCISYPSTVEMFNVQKHTYFEWWGWVDLVFFLIRSLCSAVLFSPLWLCLVICMVDKGLLYLFFSLLLFLYLQLLSSNVVPKQSRSPSLGGRTADKEAAGRIRIPHTFVLHSYMRPTVCQFCRKLLKGIIKQGMQCKDCHCNAHKKCVDKMPKDCTGESLFIVLAAFKKQSSLIVHQVVVWHPSCVSEKVGMTQKDLHKKWYSHQK